MDFFEIDSPIEVHIVKNQTIKLNGEYCKYLLSISDQIKPLKSNKLLKNNNDLYMEHWNLLKSLKDTIGDTKDHVDTLLEVCTQMNEILILKNNGTILNEDQKDYIINYVKDEFKEYFEKDFKKYKTGNIKLTNLNKKINEIIQKRKQQQKKKKNIKMKQQKLNTKKTIQKFGAAAGATIGGVAMYTGFVPVGVAVWGATGVLYTVMRRKISDEATKLDQDWEMISKPPITDDDDDDKKDWEMNIDDDDDDKKQTQVSFKPLEPFFVNLQTKIQNEKDDVMFEPLQKDIIEIIDSLKELKMKSEDLIEQIDTDQNNSIVM